MKGSVYKRSEFSRMAGVSRAAITKAVRAGYLVIENDLIDVTHPKNAAYLAANKDKRPNRNGNSSTDDAPKIKLTRLTKKSKPSLPKAFESAQIAEDFTKEAADIRRINAQTANLKLKYAEKLKTMVFREDVEQVFQNIYAVAVNYFLVLGDRLSPILASLCGISDQKIIIEIKDRIDKEVTQALKELKRQTEADL